MWNAATLLWGAREDCTDVARSETDPVDGLRSALDRMNRARQLLRHQLDVATEKVEE